MKHRRMSTQRKIQISIRSRRIGPEFAAVLVGEIFHRDFNNRANWQVMSAFAPSTLQRGKSGE